MTLLTFYRFINNAVKLNQETLKQSMDRGSAMLDSLLMMTSFASYVLHIRCIRKIYNRVLFYSKFMSENNFYRNVRLILTGEIVISQFIVQAYYLCSFLTNPEEIIEKGPDIFVENYITHGIILINLQFANVLIFFCLILNVANKELFMYLKGIERFKWQTHVHVNKWKLGNWVMIAVEKNDLSPLFKVYDDLSDTCSLLEKSFGISNTVSAAYTFVQVVEAFYYYIVVSEDTTFMFFFWFAFVVLQEWIVLYSCEYLATQVCLIQYQGNFTKETGEWLFLSLA